MSVTAFAIDHASEFSIDECVVNWWYHYYSYGRGKKIANPHPVDFTVSLYKRTPHFAEWKYDYRSCHPQIGATVTPGKSIVLVKTSIGRRRPEQGHLPPTAFVVG